MSGWLADPALGMVARGALALLFGSAAVHKLRDVDAFRRALEGYELLSAAATVRAGAAIIATEIGIAVGLCAPRVAPLAGVAAAALLTLYASAMIVNLRRGRRDIDCGCAGPARRRTISGRLVARNAVLAAVALATVPAGSGRALMWIDAVTIAAGIAAAALLYLAIDGLLSVPAVARAAAEGVHG